MEWAPGLNDARHVVVLTAGFKTPKTGTVTLFARAQSGLPFTPIVQGDVNGDGRGGDRAFIPDPRTSRDPALADQLAVAAGRLGLHRAELPRAIPRRGGGAQWMPRSVDAVAEHPVASADAGAGGAAA